MMKDETRAEIALARFKLISPVLAEPGRVQNEYFRSQTDKEHDFPHYGRRQVKSQPSSYGCGSTDRMASRDSNPNPEPIVAGHAA
jgi:hypothetical protein